jgi:hypothetical protein
MTEQVLEKAAKWERYEEHKKLSARHAVLLREVKLLAVAPLQEISYLLHANIDKLATIDLSVYPEKAWLEERQRELNSLKPKMESLAEQLRADGMSL